MKICFSLIASMLVAVSLSVFAEEDQKTKNGFAELLRDMNAKQESIIEGTTSSSFDPTIVSDYLIFRSEVAQPLEDQGHTLPPFDPYGGIGDPNPPLDPYALPGETINGSAGACMGAIAAADAAVAVYVAACRRGPTFACGVAAVAALSAMATSVAICELWFRSFEEMN